ncbi:MAG TPA: aminotransferase class I/II-fold pyridoxal phosphate-dependent enzyme, partial [Pyrinomonadaceae bacterium]|nr:aminotransferase class I/II-fold pyridoxal phosphate-dependent enzyme [Pyrinomonadaceae bacterium]
GNLMRRDDVVEIAERFNGLVVVDEAYIHFASKPSMIDEVERLPNLVVLQTFSKAWAMAGLRVGLAIAHRGVVELLNRVKPPYNVSGIAQRAVVDAFGNKTRIDNWILSIVEQRNKLAHALGQLSGVTVFSSDANFLLIKMPDADEVYEYLLRKKIVVRNRNNVQWCDGCLRITIGTGKENELLISALYEFYKLGAREQGTAS